MSLLRRNACFMAHGTYATRRITSRMNDADERAHHRRKPRRGAGCVGRCAARLVRAGLQRVRPTRLHCWPKPGSPTPPIGPVTIGRSCWTAGWWRCRRNRSGMTWNACGCGACHRRFGRTISLRHSHTCTTRGGASFNLTLHPWITGQAHRIRYLRDALSRTLGRGAIWHHGIRWRRWRVTSSDISAARRWLASDGWWCPARNYPDGETDAATAAELRVLRQGPATQCDRRPHLLVSNARSAPTAWRRCCTMSAPIAAAVSFLARSVRRLNAAQVFAWPAPSLHTARAPEMGPRRTRRRSFARCATSRRRSAERSRGATLTIIR